jgi:hypothetical protein
MGRGEDGHLFQVQGSGEDVGLGPHLASLFDVEPGASAAFAEKRAGGRPTMGAGGKYLLYPGPEKATSSLNNAYPNAITGRREGQEASLPLDVTDAIAARGETFYIELDAL